MVKIELSGSTEKRRTYPRLMQHTDGAVVLFVNEREGACVSGDKRTRLGFYSEEWGGTIDAALVGYGAWTDFTGSVTLSNED